MYYILLVLYLKIFVCYYKINGDTTRILLYDVGYKVLCFTTSIQRYTRYKYVFLQRFNILRLYSFYDGGGNDIIVIKTPP